MVRKMGPLLCLLIIFTAVSSFAAETGSLSGVVRSADGSALPGVTVTVTGPLLPGGRSTVTDDGGAFSVIRLPPGEYEVTADLAGLGNVKRSALIALDRDTQLELSLDPSVSDEITVEAAVPLIDVKSAEVQVNYTSEQIEELPIPRTYKGLFQLAPGVAENGKNTTLNAGGSRQDNTYLVDGINVTNPHYGDILPDITELDIAEVSIKRGGISAESGRTGGMVVNAITRSGTNDFAGQLRAEYQPADFVSDSKNATIQNTRDRDLIGGSLGGPILRDRFWFYGSANMPTTTTTDRRNNTGATPDEELETDEYFGKLTANPLPNHFLAASARSRDTTTGNAGLTANVHPAAGRDDSTEYLLGTFSWIWNVTSDSLAEVKFNHNEENNSTDPLTSLGYRPAFNAARPDLVGRFTTTADRVIGGATAAGQTVGGTDLGINNQDFQRDEARATFQTFKSWGGTRHDIRTGVTYDENEERLERRANGWGNITWVPNGTTAIPFPHFSANYVSAQAPHTGTAEAWGVFVQDQITIGDRTTVTAGVLVNRDEYFGEALGSTPGAKRRVSILTFDWDQQIQPRLGISFVPSLDRGDKAYFNFGRYSNTENKSLTRAASPTRLFNTTAIFDAAGNFVRETPQASTQTKTVDKNIDPMYTDEYLAGYARPLGRSWSAEVWAMFREVGDIFEDISADGLGGGPFRVAQLPGAYREYTAATLQVNRRPVGDRFMRLNVSASYTWSRLEGNWDVDYGDSLFYNSSALQDGPGTLITENRDGLLRGDRTHVAKIFASIEPWRRLRTGTYVRYQSGGAWEARALPSAAVSSTTHHRYLEPAGSRRMEDWLNVDLLASYEFVFGGIGLELEGRVTNVFDEQAVLDVDDRLLVGRVPLDSPPNNTANFGKGTRFSDPRAIVVSAIVRY